MLILVYILFKMKMILYIRRYRQVGSGSSEHRTGSGRSKINGSGSGSSPMIISQYHLVLHLRQCCDNLLCYQEPTYFSFTHARLLFSPVLYEKFGLEKQRHRNLQPKMTSTPELARSPVRHGKENFIGMVSTIWTWLLEGRQKISNTKTY